jgi:hypothetical protein
MMKIEDLDFSSVFSYPYFGAINEIKPVMRKHINWLGIYKLNFVEILHDPTQNGDGTWTYRFRLHKTKHYFLWIHYKTTYTL